MNIKKLPLLALAFLAAVLATYFIVEHIKSGNDIKNATDGLKSNDVKVRAGAINTLGQLGARDYVRDIAVALKDKDGAVRGAAVFALGKLDAREYTKDITARLKDEDDYVRLMAENVLSEWGVDIGALESSSQENK